MTDSANEYHPVGAGASAKQAFDCRSARAKLCLRIMMPGKMGNAEVLAMSQKGEDPRIMYIGYNGLWGLLVLAGDIWAVINIVQSSVSNEKKLIWILVVVLLPLLGLILWFFLGPRDRRV
jgi:hypothetical protein